MIFSFYFSIIFVELPQGLPAAMVSDHPFLVLPPRTGLILEIVVIDLHRKPGQGQGELGLIDDHPEAIIRIIDLQDLDRGFGEVRLFQEGCQVFPNPCPDDDLVFLAVTVMDDGDEAGF